MERYSQMFYGASLQNILERIYGTPLTNYRRGLLTKYSRKDIWNTTRRCSMEPLCKIF